MKNSSLIRILLLVVFIFISTTGISTSAQTGGLIETKLTSVHVDNKIIADAKWDGLKVKKGSPIKFGFQSESNLNKQIYYRIFLDGNILETNFVGNEYSFNNLNTGLHILRIIPVVPDGYIGKPLVFSFSVLDETSQNLKAIQVNPAEGIHLSMIIIYIIVSVVILQLALIIILLINRKGNEVETKEKNNALQELSEIKHSYRRIIDELKNNKEENDHLKKKIKELDTNVEMLEKVNVNLLVQKEKLSESKRKLQLLHTQKEELFAIAIHDIKNPAAAIQGYIQLLNSYELNATEQHEIMMSLASSSENIVKLSQNMCEIIAKSMPEPKLGLMPSSLINIINEVCNQNLAYAKTKKVKLLNKSSRDIPEMSLDAENIHEALDNYVNNAIKFAPPETTIEVRSFVKQGDKQCVIVEVSDNGVGLSEKDVENCFQKGIVLSSQPTGLEQSSGLGLWIVKRIIEEHKGKVWVDSKLGAGSTFSFELPVKQ